MPTEVLLLIGAGGHARVVLDALRQRNAAASVQIVDDDPGLSGQCFESLLVQDSEWCERRMPCRFHVTIGSNDARRRRFERMLAMGGEPVTVDHSAAIVAAGAVVGDGCFLAARALVAPGARIGRGTIINHGAVVDHDCTVGEFVHVAPLAALGGGVILGAGVFVGTGAVVLPRIVIGENAVIGAGAVVTRDLPPSGTVTGIPARPHSSHA